MMAFMSTAVDSLQQVFTRAVLWVGCVQAKAD